MSPAERWLRERFGERAPRGLLQRMIDALPAGGPAAGAGVPDRVPDVLAEAALALYGRVVRGRGGREDALPLLAADALYTHAMQAQAEADPDALPAFADRFGAARLRELLS